MAIATQDRRALSALHLDISAGLYGLMSRIANYRAYRRTVSELSALNANALADLGLSRSGIRAAAHAAVYGTRA